jgi:phosphate starvation-inducible membrane PsiE
MSVRDKKGFNNLLAGTFFILCLFQCIRDLLLYAAKENVPYCSLQDVTACFITLSIIALIGKNLYK